MTYLDHARRAHLTASQKHFPGLDPNRLRDWREDRNDDLLDEQVAQDIPEPEPEPLQRDLFK